MTIRLIPFKFVFLYFVGHCVWSRQATAPSPPPSIVLKASTDDAATIATTHSNNVQLEQTLVEMNVRLRRSAAAVTEAPWRPNYGTSSTSSLSSSKDNAPLVWSPASVAPTDGSASNASEVAYDDSAGTKTKEQKQFDNLEPPPPATAAAEDAPTLPARPRAPGASSTISAAGFLAHPSDISGYESGSVLLMCVLAPSATVGAGKSECYWRRNGIPVQMGDRYRLAAAAAATTTTVGTRPQEGKNCSLLVTSLAHLDEGSWQCGNGMTWSASASLRIVVAPPPPVSIVRHPANTTVLEGEQATLLCLFNGSVNCTWKRDGHTLVIGNRYAYLTAGNVTTDCSLRIPRVERVDAGLWRCGRLTVADMAPLWSEEARLLVQVAVAPGKPVIGVTRLPLSEPAGGGLECSVDAAFPAATLAWQLDDHWMAGEQRVSQVGISGEGTEAVPLYSTRLTWNVSGGWGPFNDARILRCWLQHPGLPVQEKTTIRIEPQAIAPTLPEMQLDGRSVSELSLQPFPASSSVLECVSRGGNPAANLSWELDGSASYAAGVVKVTSDGANLFSSRLRWAPTDVDGGGQTYQRHFNGSKVLRCVGRHPAWVEAVTGNSVRYATLYITTTYAVTEAHILQPIAPTSGAVQEDEARVSILRCTADGYPLPDYNWQYRPNASFAWRQVGGGAELRVDGRSGHFRCLASNVLNVSPALKEVRIGKPGASASLSSNNIIAYALLLAYSLLVTVVMATMSILFVNKKWIFAGGTSRRP